jgi:plastocyanin
MRMRGMWAAMVLCVAALPACGGGGSSSSSPPCPPSGSPRAAVNGEVTVCAFDIRYDTRDITAPAGPLKITLINKGSIRHTLTIEDPELNLVTPGKNDVDSGTVTLAKGEYKFECTEDAHAGAGMTGKIVVS